MPVSIYGDTEVIEAKQTPVTLQVASEDGKYKVTKQNTFIKGQ